MKYKIKSYFINIIKGTNYSDYTLTSKMNNI